MHNSISNEYHIRTPQDLSRIIHMVKEALKGGRLVEIDYWPERRIPFYRASFETISEKGPWPDYVEYYFEDTTTKQCFRLVCETYHGFGGKWGVYQC